MPVAVSVAVNAGTVSRSDRKVYSVNPVANGKCQMADPCLYCSSGIGHAPLIVVYDRDEGAYLPAPEGEELCSARYVTGSGGHAPGDVCGKPADEWAGDVPLCRFHFKRMGGWFAAEGEATRKADHELRIRQMEELNRKAIDLEAERIAARAVAMSPYSVVYYIRRTSDGAVKIGFTASIGDRTAVLRGQHGPLQVLLALGGARDEESDAHNRFREYRIGRTEWFRPARPLLEWILEARAGHTHPDVQPDDVLPVDELRQLVLAAPPREVLRWDDNGYLQWPPGAAVA